VQNHNAVLQKISNDALPFYAGMNEK